MTESWWEIVVESSPAAGRTDSDLPDWTVEDVEELKPFGLLAYEGADGQPPRPRGRR